MTFRRLLPGLVLLIAVLLGATLFADARKLAESLVAFPWWRMAPALGLSLLNYALRSWRMDFYLRSLGVRLPRTEVVLVFVAGFVFSVTPGKLGEVFKAYILKERRGVPIADTTTIVIAERFTDVLGLLLIAAFGVYTHGTGQTLFLSVIGLAVCFLAGVAHPTLVPAAARRFSGAIARFALLSKIVAAVERVHGALRTLCTPRKIFVATLVAAIAWLAECIAFRLILDGFSTPGGGLDEAVLVYAMATLFGAVSMLPGGMGSTEALMVALSLEVFHLAGTLEEATAATLLVRFATLWFAVGLGGVSLAWLRRGARRLAP